MKQFFKANWAMVLITVLAGFFRFWQITHLPPGLFPDEAANGLDVNSIFQGDIQPFYERGNGREALFFYFEALSVLLFGRGVWQFHIVSAAFGLASVVALYFLAQRMFGKNVALLATFFMAISSYAVAVSRTAFRANTVPLFSILTILFLVKFFQSDDPKTKYWSAALSGLFFALGFYTYISFRMMIPLLLGFGLLLFLSQRSNAKEVFRIYTKYKAVFVAAFLAGISWIAVYFIQNPKSFVGRAGHVSIWNPDLNNGDILGTLLLVIKDTMLGFFTTGDLNWRHNVSGFPFLSPLISPFFALGLIIFTIAMFRLLKQVWEQKLQSQTVYQALVACWFWFMTAPEITTAEGIPHGLRLIGVIPPMFILTAWGVDWLWRKLPHHPDIKLEKTFFVGIFISSLLVYNFVAYFGVTAASPENYRAFRGDLTVVSDYLNARNNKAQTYLALDEFWLQTTDYLTTDKNQPYRAVDPWRVHELQLESGAQVIFTQSTLFDRIKFSEYHPQAKLIRQDINQFGEIIMLVYEQP